jgi:hypothetical protein
MDGWGTSRMLHTLYEHISSAKGPTQAIVRKGMLAPFSHKVNYAGLCYCCVSLFFIVGLYGIRKVVSRVSILKMYGLKMIKVTKYCLILSMFQIPIQHSFFRGSVPCIPTLATAKNSSGNTR